MNYAAIVAACEADVRANQTQAVAKRLNGLTTARVPRAYRLPLANLCRRAGLYSLGITLLTRLVYPGKSAQTRSVATQAELAEYAVLLLRSGALGEACEILDQVSPEEVPESLLYRAFAHFSGWEFTQAVAPLERYLGANVSPYAALVGKVNLAYAYVESGQTEAAHALLAEIIELTGQNGHARLQGNCHSLRAQLLMKSNDYPASLRELEVASRLLGGANNEDYQFITKWKLIVHALQTRSLQPLERLRALASRAQDWEGMREADLFSLKIYFQKARFLHLLFGTPFGEYRARIFRETGQSNDRDVYVLGEKTSPRFDLRTAEIDGHEGLNPGRKSHQLIDVLLRDFYRPQRVPALFSHLFPGDHYDVSSSPDRVHQTIRRTRRWLEGENIPLSIEETDGFYSLLITGKFSFRVPLERRQVERMTLHFDQLVSTFGADRSFSAKDAKEKLGLSRRTVQRLMTWGIEAGRIERQGPNPTSVRYRILQAA